MSGSRLHGASNMSGSRNEEPLLLSIKIHRRTTAASGIKQVEDPPSPSGVSVHFISGFHVRNWALDGGESERW